MAERSKAPDLGSGLFGGASSNLAPIIFYYMYGTTEFFIYFKAAFITYLVGWPSGPRR